MNQKTTFCSRVVGEEGEEKRPPLGKDINRPKNPNHSPPSRHVNAHASSRDHHTYIHVTITGTRQ